MKRLLLVAALTASVAAIIIPSASASTRVLPLSAQQFGWTYDQWNAVYVRRLAPAGLPLAARAACNP